MGIKRSGRETSHTSSSAEIKSGGDVPPLPHFSWQFTFYYYVWHHRLSELYSLFDTVACTPSARKTAAQEAAIQQPLLNTASQTSMFAWQQVETITEERCSQCCPCRDVINRTVSASRLWDSRQPVRTLLGSATGQRLPVMMVMIMKMIRVNYLRGL
jgi:hypothetical protein